MDQLLIEGGRPLAGEVRVSGAKNAALPILCAALLTPEPLVLTNVPRLNDVRTMQTLLAQMGVAHRRARRRARSRSTPARIDWPLAPYELVKTMRASILALGPLVARCGEARVSLPGGCAIGLRPVDQHVKGLAAMGAEIDLEHGYISARARAAHRRALRVRRRHRHRHREPDDGGDARRGHDHARERGARAGDRRPRALPRRDGRAHRRAPAPTASRSKASSRLHGATHAIMPDRIETGTFLAAVAAAGGEATLTGAQADTLDAVLDKLREAGADDRRSTATRSASRGAGRSRAFALRTAPYPGVPDRHAGADDGGRRARRRARRSITETIFENRMMHVQELVRLGADIEVEGNTAIVRGVPKLTGANVMATDLRASACLVIAGLVAEGARRSTASTISTAATSGSRRSSRRWARSIRARDGRDGPP